MLTIVLIASTLLDAAFRAATASEWLSHKSEGFGLEEVDQLVRVPLRRQPRLAGSRGRSELLLEGNMRIPSAARGLVLFAHGSGSSRHSPRNRVVAAVLQRAGLATLLIDLLTSAEEGVDDVTAELRFDIPMLGARLIEIAEWLASQPSTRPLRLGMFGASTGAGAALIAAAERPRLVSAVVSRGGRPDLAKAALPGVQAPTMLIVGGEDLPVIAMNREALDQLRCEKQLVIVPGATHLFKEPGALEQVAALARDWFLRHLGDHRTKAA